MLRERRPRKGGCRHPAVVLLLAALLLPGAVAPASSADKSGPAGAQGATRVLPPQSSDSAAPLIPPAAPTGMCQCIADRDRRHIGCLASVDQCKAACGERYSFVPDAPSCPVTAQRQGK
jgi:hypothetical protein